MTIRRRLFLYSILFLFYRIATAQTAMPDPAQMLVDGRQQTTLETPKTPPFHLKATFETFDYLGVSSGTGTIENWWDGKSRARHDTTYRGETESLVRDGKLYISGNLDHPVIESKLVNALYVPVLVRPEELPKFDLTLLPKQIVGGISLDCILVQPKETPGGTPESYCFSPQTKVIRAVTSGFHFTTAYHDTQPYGALKIPHEIVISQDNHRRAILHIQSIEEWQPDDNTFAPPLNWHSPAPPVRGVSSDSSRKVVAGKLLKKVDPFYPAEARSKHIEGVVVLRVVISREGKPTDIEVYASDDPSFSVAAVQAVGQWVYKPFELDGQPAPVSTTIQVSFNLPR